MMREKPGKGDLFSMPGRGFPTPDGFQAPDETIYISYDRNREADGEILMARFTEEDILKGKFAGRRSKGKILISKPTGLDKLPAPSELIRK